MANQKTDGEAERGTDIVDGDIVDADVRIPVATIIPPRQLISFNVGTLELRKLKEISEILWLPENLDEGEKNARTLRALELYESLEPSGGAEGMLAVQMVGTHSAAQECLRRAALANQTVAGRNTEMAHAQKLMALYTKQLATLDKHRGKGRPKVAVGQVNVAQGGQAIVGNVETGTRDAGDLPEPPAVENVPEVPLDPLKNTANAQKSPVRRGKG